MPGKVNPSVPEMVNQVCFQVIGCDTTVCAAAEAGQLELNVMMPVIAWNALHASTILRNAMTALATRCVDGIEADRRALPRAARSQHRGGHRAQPLHRLRRRRRRSPRSRCGPASRFARSCSTRGLLDRSRPRIACSRASAMTEPGVAGETEPSMRRRPLVICRACAARWRSRRLRSLARRSRPHRRGTGSSSRPRTSACSKRPTAPRGRSRIRSWTRSASPTARTSPTSAPAPAGSPSRLARRVGPERRRLRAGRAAADARGDSPARAARGAAERADRARPRQLAQPAARTRSTRCSSWTPIRRCRCPSGSRFLRISPSALKPNGRIGIVNYKLGGGGPGPDDPGLRVPRASVERDAARGRTQGESVGKPALPVPAGAGPIVEFQPMLMRQSDRPRWWT